jgi:hypothetical protein
VKRLRLDDSPFSLLFERKTDRWWHRLIVEQAGLETAILQSVEGDSSQNWPPSPPLQDLAQQLLTDGSTAILGVGKAGKSHWSASFSKQQSTQPIRNRWLVEFACLCPPDASPPTLCTTYEIAESMHLEKRDNSIRIAVAHRELKIESLDAKERSTELRLTPGQLLASPIHFPHDGKKSVRWGYCLELL